jgi:1-acyl-sn-glycerol-3-phosphate acyltransferase
MLRTGVYFVYVIISVLFLTPFGFVITVFSFLGLRRPMSHVMYRIAQGWALLLIKAIGCPITVTGRENIPPRGGVCFVSNHGSIFDIVLLLAYSGRPFGFVAKKELLWIPFINMWIAILGGLFIDRKNVRKAVKTINRGIAHIRAGGGMVVFAEGRRSRGQGLLPFHPGSLKLATQAEAFIVPVALKGTYDIFEKNYRLDPVPIQVSFGRLINTAEIPPTDRKQLLAEKIHGVIKEALEQR